MLQSRPSVEGPWGAIPSLFDQQEVVLPFLQLIPARSQIHIAPFYDACDAQLEDLLRGSTHHQG